MILVTFTERDRPRAEAIAKACGDRGYSCRLDPRDDWIAQALRGFGETGAAILVVSEHDAASWWLPFWVGRASERDFPFAAFLTDRCFADLPFLRGRPLHTTIDSLVEWVATAATPR